MEHVRDELPKKGKEQQKKKGTKKKVKLTEEPPKLPSLVKSSRSLLFTLPRISDNLRAKEKTNLSKTSGIYCCL
jgi:hypothetical protein